MKRLFFFVAVCLFFPYSPVFAESINEFTSKATIHKDGSVEVTEVIVYDFGEVERHGIYRDINDTHPQQSGSWLTKRLIEAEVVHVQKNNEAVPYVLEKGADSVRVKIGDPDVTVTGEQTYLITYLLQGALSYGSSGSEFYYNVTGNEWPVPIKKVTATISGDDGVKLSALQACYAGVSGMTTPCDEMSLEGGIATFSAVNLLPLEGLTMAQSLDPLSVAVLVREVYTLNWILYLVGFIWILGLLVWAYRFHTKNKVALPVIAQYEPYEQVLPMYAGVLIDSALDPQDITAGIVYLAQLGILKIKRTEEKVLWVFNTTEYELTLLRSPQEVNPPMLREVLTLIFSEGSEVGTTVRLSELAKKRVQNAALLQKLRSAAVDELKKDGFLNTFSFKKLPWKRLGVIFAVFLWVFIFFNAVFASIVFFLSVLIYALAHVKQKTTKGYEAVNHMKGFKLFLSVTEKERYTFFNVPEKNPELFMQFLPYAIALKVEKEWAEVFKDISIPVPSWYDGGNMQSFSAVALSNDIGAFSSTFSSSSGTQGSSGGGSSGGGGGGGGGGSW
jgi:uncharacterized membrane protein YgcG